MISSMGAMGEATVNGQTQASMCAAAAEAIARGNPAAPGLAQQCTEARRQNIAAGDLILDAQPVDATMRVFLHDTGARIIAGESALTAIAAKLAPDVAHGFAIGIKVARAHGGLNAAYAAKVRATLSPIMAQGFDMATGAGGVKSTGPTSGNPFGLSTPVLVGAGVVGLGLIAAVAFKLHKHG